MKSFGFIATLVIAGILGLRTPDSPEMYFMQCQGGV